MTLDLIPSEQSRESRANEAAITQVIALDDSVTEWQIMLWGLALI
jgi:hypothetical protein